MDIMVEEKKYLDKVLKTMDEQINKFEKELEQLYSLGKSLSFEDRKRGEHFSVNSRADKTSKKIRTLNNSISTPYFGRMDFKSVDDVNYKKYYIGRAGISSENGELLVIDWRSPVSSMYYNNSIGEAEYIAPQGIIQGDINLKRQIIIENSELKEILDTDIVTNDEILQEYLNVHADEKMKNIIASIQQEQNNIIRKPINNNIIVQGVAGSGKTSVALHRIAFLLYNIKENAKSNNFLLLGPNKYFLDYISSVLPELEIEPIEQKRFVDFASEYIEEKISLKNQKYKTENFEEKKMLDKLIRYKNSLEYMKGIEKFMNSYLQGSFINKGIEFDGIEIFDKDFVKETVLSGVITKFNFKRAEKITIARFKDNKDIIYLKLNQRYKDIYLSSDDEEKVSDAYRKSAELRELIYKKGEKKIKDFYRKLDKKPSEIYNSFIENCEKYLLGLTEEEIRLFKQITVGTKGKVNITQEDLPSLIYINSLITDKKMDYTQIAIDEAQDYGLFQYYVLLKTCPDAKFSIYGDLAQCIYPYTNVSDWNDVKNNIFGDQCEILNLSRSYRTTKEITENANSILDAINLSNADSVERHGNPVEYHKKTKEDTFMIEKIQEWLEKKYQSIGIVCKNEKEALKLYKLFIKNNINVSYLDDKTTNYEGGICITSSRASKGLEFDAVIINDASSDIYDYQNKEDMHLLYVALTRALHELLIMYSNELCEPLKNNCNEESRKKIR